MTLLFLGPFRAFAATGTDTRAGGTTTHWTGTHLSLVSLPRTSVNKVERLIQAHTCTYIVYDYTTQSQIHVIHYHNIN